MKPPSLAPLLALILSLFLLPATRAAAASDCHVGTWRLAGGELVDFAAEGDGLRWRTLSGRVGLLKPDGAGWRGLYGWTDAPDGLRVALGTCGAQTIRFDGRVGRRTSAVVTEAHFLSHGVRLAGRLVMPPGSGPVPVMVLGHGSEKSSARDGAFRQRLYPAAGVAVFVFDKRGTGASEGTYTQDFDVLADDVVAAVAEARRLAGARAGRVGLQGGSQAGWVLPLAAARTPVDFVIVGYGIAASPIEEDRNETLQDMAAAGWGPAEQAKATEVAAAAAELIRSRFTRGFEAFNAVVARYRGEPWFADLKGEFTGELVRLDEATLHRIGPGTDAGTPWDYDAVGALRVLPAPLLWMVAGDDTEGAGPESRAVPVALRRAGRPVTVALFPGTEHGIHVIRTVGRTREHVAYAADYFRMELDYARTGRLAGRYPSAQLLE